jgi:ribokinase
MPAAHNFSSLNVVVVGSYNADLIMSCDPFPVLGRSIQAGEFSLCSGGRGGNCAVAAARAGCQVKFVGAHGPDVFGKLARERLARENIDITHFVELPLARTGVAMSFLDARTGEDMVAVARSANHEYPPTLVTEAEPAIRAADLIFTQLETDFSVVLEVFRLCALYNKRLIVHAAPVGPETRIPPGDFYLMVQGHHEALALTHAKSLAGAISRLHELGCEHVIVVNGTESLISSDEHSSQNNPLPERSRLHFGGAAECVTAWAGITLALTKDLNHAAELAAEAMAFSMARPGAQESMPYPSELNGSGKSA